MDVPYAIDRLVTYGVPATGKKSSCTLHTGETTTAAFLTSLHKILKFYTKLTMVRMHRLQQGKLLK